MIYHFFPHNVVHWKMMFIFRWCFFHFFSCRDWKKHQPHPDQPPTWRLQQCSTGAKKRRHRPTVTTEDTDIKGGLGGCSWVIYISRRPMAIAIATPMVVLGEQKIIAPQTSIRPIVGSGEACHRSWKPPGVVGSNALWMNFLRLNILQACLLEKCSTPDPQLRPFATVILVGKMAICKCSICLSHLAPYPASWIHTPENSHGYYQNSYTNLAKKHSWLENHHVQ